MNDDRGIYIEKKLETALAYVHDNWEDDIAKQYITYVENIIQQISNSEKQGEQIQNRAEEIIARCRQIEDSDTDKPYVRVRR